MMHSICNLEMLNNLDTPSAYRRASLSFGKYIFLVMLGCLGVVFGSYAQTSQNSNTLSLYHLNSKVKFAEVNTTAKYNVLASLGSKLTVQFIKPTVPGWVSERFVSYADVDNSSSIRVSVDALNFRLQADINSPRLTQVYRGYTSPVLARKNGFVKILAPASLKVIIDNPARLVPQQATTINVSDRSSNTPANGAIQKTESVADLAAETVPPTVTSQPEVRPKQDETGFSTSGEENLLTESQPKEQSDLIGSQQSEQNHQIAPGDAISLLVFGEPDLSIENVRVPQSGQVSFPLIGAVPVLGKTTAEIETEVAALLAKGYVRNPRLSVTIFSYRPIFIRGEVNSTGSFPYNEGLTVAKAVALAGGAKSSANPQGISITRDGKVVAEGLSVNSLVRVASGDVVSVNADEVIKQAESSFIYLHGEVAQAGEYEFRPGLTVEKAVVLAGGFTIRASKKKVKITRYSVLDENGAPEKLKRVKLYTPVKPGDVINVGASWF